MFDFDPYSLLGVSRNATAEDIKRAHRRLAQRLHPDANPNNPGAAEQFQDISNARDLLLDDKFRRQYDEEYARRQTTDSYFTLRVTPSRRVLVPLPEEQILYLLAEIFAAPQTNDGQKQETHLNLTLVLDHSNSMGGKSGRMERVKFAAQRLIKDLSHNDIISVVAFNDRATIIIPATPAQDKIRLSARVDLIRPFGGTEIYQGLLAGVAQNKEYLSPRMVNHIILLTDGKTYGDQEQCLQLAKEASAMGIGISAMGLGHDWNDEFLDKLAAFTGGSSSFINSADAVARFFNDHVKSLVNSFAERMYLSVAPDPDVKLEMAFQLSPTPQPLLIDGGRIPLASLQPNRPISVLLQYQMPANMENGFRTVARMIAAGDILRNTHQAYRAVSDMSLEVNESPPREDTPSSIIDALGKLTLYRLQERAKDALDKGNIAEATRRLENLATRLLEMGESTLAEQTLSEAQYIARTRTLSDVGRKTIKYQTRALVGGNTNILEMALSSMLKAPDE